MYATVETLLCYKNIFLYSLYVSNTITKCMVGAGWRRRINFDTNNFRRKKYFFLIDLKDHLHIWKPFTHTETHPHIHFKINYSNSISKNTLRRERQPGYLYSENHIFVDFQNNFRCLCLFCCWPRKVYFPWEGLGGGKGGVGAS